MTGGVGGTAAAHMLCNLFTSHPELVNDETDIHIHHGRVEISCNGGTGVVRNWARALPEHRETAGLAKTAYGSTEAVVLTQDVLVVTIKPPIWGAR